MLTPQTVANYLEIDTTEINADKLALLVEEATALMVAYAPVLKEQWNNAAQVVLLRIVARGYQSTGTSIQSLQVSAGPFQKSYTYSQLGLYLSRADKAILNNAGRPGGIHAISLLDTDYIYTKGPQPDLWEEY